MNAGLELDGVVRRVAGRAIIDQVSLRLAPATLTALVGPNGAGKSTLLALAAGDIAPSQGTVRLDGRPISQWKAKALARQRAVMPQDHAVRFAFSVREVVAMGRLAHPPDLLRDEQMVETSMRDADVLALAERDIQTLSGGEAARAAFARVLVQDTPLILLDEPTAALDLHHQESLLRLLRRRADAGACVVVVLHDLNLAAAHADRIVLLENGRIAADGTPREVLVESIIEKVYRQPVRVLEHPTRRVPLVVVVDRD
ncbi:MAG: heme ABC transporter ATP-binding protein [Lysobacteraceae bacterium]